MRPGSRPASQLPSKRKVFASMPQCIAAVFTLASALFSAPKGRHSARRRRSRRVRRYARALPSASRTTPPVRSVPRTVPSPRTPRLSPPSTELRAEDIALVRPYLAAHEECDLAQESAMARLRAWGAEPLPATRTRPPVQDFGTDFPVPQPRTPAPRVPSRMEELPHLARLRRRQRQRLAGVAV